MGLGPPLCKRCWRMLELDEGQTPPWFCPSCGGPESDMRAHLWTLTPEERAKLEESESRLCGSEADDEDHYRDEVEEV